MDPKRLSRRDVLRAIGRSGFATGLGVFALREGALADPTHGFSGTMLGKVVQPNQSCPTLVDGHVIQPRRELPVLDKTDVLVIGGGPAGVAAAIAARRTGVKVTLVERYGHFGGLWSGGLVLIVLGHIAKGGQQVCMGIGEEIMQRLDKVDRGIVNRRPGVNPTVDAEALKYVMLDMIREAGVQVYLHCWGVDAIMANGAVAGAVFESKSGRQAILSKTVVDASGDGDIFAAAGAEFSHYKYSIGLVSRLGNLDRIDQAQAKQGPKPRNLGSPTPVPGVNWVNMLGPEADGLDVAELSRLEMNHRRFIWESTQKIRKTPGYAPVYLVETAPQLGVRITRMLTGVKTLTKKDFDSGKQYPDVVGVGGAWGADHDAWQIPYGALVPQKIDNLLAAGRCISAELAMADMVRVIAICFVTGQAAGVAAAVAVQDGCRPRDVAVAKVQKLLRQQEAYLG
jgi:hypothetical protein